MTTVVVALAAFLVGARWGWTSHACRMFDQRHELHALLDEVYG